MPSFKMKFSGVTILQGIEFSIFPIDFEWALQQCSATALPVMRSFAYPEVSVSVEMFVELRTDKLVMGYSCGDYYVRWTSHTTRKVMMIVYTQVLPSGE